MSYVLVCWSVLPLLPPCLLFTSHTTGFHHYHIKCPARTAQPVYYCFAHWLILVTEGYRSNLVKVDYYIYKKYLMALIFGFCGATFQISCTGSKVPFRQFFFFAKMALLNLCMKFEIFFGQKHSFEA